MMRYVSLVFLVAAFACGGADEPGRGDCMPGETRCQDGVAEACGAEEAWKVVEVCAHGCAIDGCAGAVCVEDATRCVGDRLERCEDGAWAPSTECEYGCIDGGCAPACAPGERRCDGDAVLVCDEAEHWTQEEVCPAACVEGACVGVCREGERRCDGLQPQGCEGADWVDAGDACLVGCEHGACTEQCAPGETECVDGGLSTCGADGRWEDPRACEFACVSGSCVGACVPGEVRCDGLAPQQCGEEGEWLAAGEACAFVCEDGGCAGECTPSSTRCGDTGSVERCDAQGRWKEIQACAAGCDDGACLPECQADERRCGGSGVQSCSDGRWIHSSPCHYGCEDGECLECMDGESFCDGGRVFTCRSGRWDEGLSCGVGEICSDGACVVRSDDCGASGPGLSDCGPDGNESCCRSLPVPGGSFFQDNDPRFPATVAPFRLDAYEVTVGRFRRFVEAMEEGWTPDDGAGKHLHLYDGRGLLERGTPDAFERGWDPAWTARLPGDWDASLSGAWGCNWTSKPEDNEKKAMNCVHWEEAYAFCIWDGGFLPSEAEWNFAAAGGGGADGQRVYPWGDDEPDDVTDYAILMDGCGGWCAEPMDVGTTPSGAGRWGHLDLAGNVSEWVLDWYTSTPYFGGACEDCTRLSSNGLPSNPMRGMRGGAYWDTLWLASTDYRYYGSPDFRVMGAGVRCARDP